MNIYLIKVDERARLSGPQSKCINLHPPHRYLKEVEKLWNFDGKLYSCQFVKFAKWIAKISPLHPASFFNNYSLAMFKFCKPFWTPTVVHMFLNRWKLFLWSRNPNFGILWHLDEFEKSFGKWDHKNCVPLSTVFF